MAEQMHSLASNLAAKRTAQKTNAIFHNPSNRCASNSLRRRATLIEAGTVAFTRQAQILTIPFWINASTAS